MKIVDVENAPRLHEVPLPLICIKKASVIVQLDDETEKRLQLEFSPYQGVRITTADCFKMPSGLPVIRRTIMEIQNSSWISELRDNLKNNDMTANFLDKSRHFLLPLGDDFLEVVAWDITSIQLQGREI